MRPPRPDRFDVVVVGDYFKDWLTVLAPESDLWLGMPEIASVRRESSGWPGGEGAERRLVLPLLENDIRNCPAGWALVPPRQTLETFGDKASFAKFADAGGLADLVPRTYPNPEAAVFPCVVKRTDLYASYGVHVVFSAEELAGCLSQDPWKGHPYILQEYVEANVDYSISGVAASGMLVFHCTSVFDPPKGSLIRIPLVDEIIQKVELRARDIFAIQRFMAKSSFCGPFNISSRRRPSGDLSIIEINPRFGGSMFRRGPRDDLREMIRTIIQHAVWHEPGQ